MSRKMMASSVSFVGWLGSRMVSMLDSGAEGPGFKSQSRRCWVTVFSKLFTPIVLLFTKQQLVAVLLRVAGVTAGLVESNGSLLPDLWLTSPAGWLPRTGISSGTLRSVIEHGLPFKVNTFNKISSGHDGHHLALIWCLWFWRRDKSVPSPRPIDIC